MVTMNSHVFLGRITPVFGRTQYLLGDVVLTLKATYSLDLLIRWTTHELCFFTSKVNWSSRGWISTRSWPIAAGRRGLAREQTHGLHNTQALPTTSNPLAASEAEDEPAGGAL